MTELDAGLPLPSARKREALELFAPLPRHYDRVAAALSFGQDPRWRKAMVEAIAAKREERVLDVATGTGLVAQSLVRRYGCEVVGVDQSPQMLAAARARVAANKLLAERVSLVQGEAEHLPFGDGELDHLTFTYLLRYVEDPAATMSELARVVKPGGRLASLEFAVPANAVWRASWKLYTHVGPADARAPRLARVGPRGQLLGRQHSQLLRALPDRACGSDVGAGRHRRCPRSADELGRRSRDVGNQAGLRTARRPRAG